MQGARYAMALVALALPACKKAPALPPAPPPVRFLPKTAAELPTTSGEIALHNLDAQIESQEAMLARRPGLEEIQRLAPLISTRARFLSRPADLERLVELGERAVRDNPGFGPALLLRAESRAAVHRFDAALADLALAAGSGADAPSIAKVRASILSARGKPEEALALVATDDLYGTGVAAGLLGELGRLPEAERAFARAEPMRRDLAPFPIAWLYFTAGQTFQRAGDADRALAFYQAAVERVPGYAPALAHLAQLLVANGKPERARAVLEGTPLADPELAARLAEVSPDKPERLEAARQAYADAFRRLPEAYADHAARFWLGAGADARAALAAARLDLAARGTEASYDLALRAAITAGDTRQTCDLARRAREAHPGAAALGPLLSIADERCAAVTP